MTPARPREPRLVLGVACLGTLALPFVSVRTSRIAAPSFRGLADAAGHPAALLAVAAGVALVLALALSPAPRARLAIAALGIGGLLAGLGQLAALLGAGLGPYARIAPGPGAWSLLGLLALFFADAATRLALGPARRLALGAAVCGGLLALLGSELLAPLSIMVEYHTRAASFWSEAARHLLLCGGSFALALGAGVPLGLLAARRRRLAEPLMGLLTAAQTVPSIAMFAVLIAPLGWLAARSALAAGLGISGIGVAPALLALFVYALLPIVGGTLAGLRAVPAPVVEAARAIGLDDRQRRWGVEFPMALPFILAGARIALVQGIGLATVGALIGAGGFGVFVFQGIGQTASDLVLLGALPPVALAMMAALGMDAVIASLPGARR